MFPSTILRSIGNVGRSRALPPLAARWLATRQPPPQPSKDSEEHDARSYQVLTRLAKIASALREAIQVDANSNINTPQLLLDLERDVDAAFSLVTRALDAAGRPCTLEQLKDRKTDDLLKGLGNAVPYSDMLQAQLLRDEIENTLVNLDVMPPQDSLLDGAGRLMWKKARKERQAAESSALRASTEQAASDISPEDAESEEVLKELRPVTKEELARRKAHMEKSTDIRHVLRGFDTALLDVGRVHKVVKGGTNMSVRALVAIGNRKGVAGYGEGKSENAQHAIERACRDARRNLLSIDLREDRTVQHRLAGRFVKTWVDVWPAPRGTGISASNDFAIVLELFGLKDVGTKIRGSRPKGNSVKALFNALSQNSTYELINRRRSMHASEGNQFGPYRVARQRGGL